MNVKLNLKEKMHIVGTATGSGHFVDIDASETFGGQNLGPSPMELVAIGVGGCTSMDVLAILRKKKVDFTGYDLEIEVESARENPRVFTKMHFKYILTGHNLNKEDIERAIELSETKYCQGIAMMRKSAEITHELVLLDPAGTPC